MLDCNHISRRVRSAKSGSFLPTLTMCAFACAAFPAHATGSDAARTQLQSPAPPASVSAESNLPAAEPRPEPCVASLLPLLKNESAEVHILAVYALARAHGSRATQALAEVAADSQLAPALRAAAVQGLSRRGSRPALQQLVELTACSDSGVSDAALAAVAEHVPHNPPHDAQNCRAWWQEQQKMSDADWYQAQAIALNTALAARDAGARQLEDRLTAELRKTLQSAEPARREALLLTYLADDLPAIRRLGVELVESERSEDGPLSASLAAAIRARLDDSEPLVQAAAVPVVVGLRDGLDGPHIMQLLQTATSKPLRAALLNGLGYLGDAEAVTALVQELESGSGAARLEAVNALGRLAERGVLIPEQRPEMRIALLAVLDSPVALNGQTIRERTLWALGRLADPSLTDRFVESVSSCEPAGVRQVAVAALALLDHEPSTLGLLRACNDPEPSVGRPALEALARRPTHAGVQAALWSAALADDEADDSTRPVAWSGITRHLAGRPWDEVRAAMRKLPLSDAATPSRCEELANLALAEQNSGQAWRHEVRRTQADICRSAGAAAAALRAYLTGLPEFKDAAARAEFALELLHFALRSGQYRGEVHAALLNALVTPDALWSHLWTALKGLQQDNAALCRSACEAVRIAANGSAPADFDGKLDELMAALAAPVPSPPTDGAASQAGLGAGTPQPRPSGRDNPA